jgi:uncharacterized protein YpbB
LFEVMKLMDLEKSKFIKELISSDLELNWEQLKPIKEKLEELWRQDINYFDIKLALSMIKKKDI